MALAGRWNLGPSDEPILPLRALEALFANACLLGVPGDLGPSLRALAEHTQAYFGAHFEEQTCEPCFGTAALSLVARARDRGFDVRGEDPHPSMPLAPLRLPRGALPEHPWYDWPSPDLAFQRCVVEAFEREGAVKPKPKPKPKPKQKRAGPAAKSAASGRARPPGKAAKAAKAPKKKLAR